MRGRCWAAVAGGGGPHDFLGTRPVRLSGSHCSGSPPASVLCTVQGQRLNVGFYTK